MTLGVEAGSAMLKMLPQLDEMLKPTGGKLGKIVSYQGYPEAYQDLALGRLDLRRQHLAQPGIDRQVEARHVRGRPSRLQADLYRLAGGERQHRTACAHANAFLLGTRKDGSMYALQKKCFDTTFEHMPEVPSATV